MLPVCCGDVFVLFCLASRSFEEQITFQTLRNATFFFFSDRSAKLTFARKTRPKYVCYSANGEQPVSLCVYLPRATPAPAKQSFINIQKRITVQYFYEVNG